MMKIFIFIAFLQVFLLFGCSKQESTQQSTNTIGKLTQSTSEAADYAQKIYGDKVQMVLNGDVNANGKTDGLALEIRGTIANQETTWWIARGGVVEKGDDGWKVILDLKDKIRTPEGELINQVPADNGYVFNFDLSQSPIVFKVSIANAGGNPVSDEITIKWSTDKNNYEVSEDEKLP